ncbi:tyrosine-type recombinase/integrase, partial [Vibrio splendidus]|uniref:tyrosine-type recombinase/integrase n=1 Tax=Vibrio splendidus TaxID=29497 RepID=UPI000D4692ED
VTVTGLSYRTIDIEVQLFPELEVQINADTGEVTEVLKHQNNPSTKIARLLLDADGKPMYPFNIWLHNKLSNGEGEVNGGKPASNCNTAAGALLLYLHWLDEEGLRYDSLSANPREGALWKFKEFLAENLKEVDPNTQKIIPKHFTDPETGEQIKYDGLISLSTARTYISQLISFYKWLHRTGLLPITDLCKPFEFKWVKAYTYRNQDAYLLSHTNKNRMIEVQTTDLMQSLPKVQSKPEGDELKPMLLSELTVFEDELKRHKDVKSLMCEMSIKTGLRAAELLSFPEACIEKPLVKNGLHYPVMATIGNSLNGCKTKNDKIRTIVIPTELAQKLYEYKHSSNRLNRIKASNSADSAVSHGRLFVSNRGKPFSRSSLSGFFTGLRDNIRNISGYEDWYFTPHDMRSTFATNYLLNKSRGDPSSVLIHLERLAALLGHESTATTMKYVKFIKRHEVLLSNAKVKNERARYFEQGYKK